MSENGSQNGNETLATEHCKNFAIGLVHKLSWRTSTICPRLENFCSVVIVAHRFGFLQLFLKKNHLNVGETSRLQIYFYLWCTSFTDSCHENLHNLFLIFIIIFLEDFFDLLRILTPCVSLLINKSFVGKKSWTGRRKHFDMNQNSTSLMLNRKLHN